MTRQEIKDGCFKITKDLKIICKSDPKLESQNPMTEFCKLFNQADENMQKYVISVFGIYDDFVFEHDTQENCKKRMQKLDLNYAHLD